MAGEFHVRAWDPLNREYLGDLPLYNCQYNSPLTDPGEFTGTLAVEAVDRATITHLKRALNYETAFLAVYYGQTIPWTGRIIAAPWNRETGTVSVKASATRSWLDHVFIGRGRANRYEWKNVEQAQIVREIIAAAALGAGGRLSILPDASTTGIRRDLVIEAQSYSVISDVIDSLAERESGFDWDILARESAADGLPEFYLGLWHPERASPTAPRYHLADLGEHANILNDPGWPEDASGRRSMVHALGDGEAPGKTTAVDYDPLLETNRMLLTEATVSHSGQGITSALDLAELANAERIKLSRTVSTLTVAVGLDDPAYGTWQTGDRFRLQLRDDWLDTDLSAVRCVDHSVHFAQTDGNDLVSLELDVADNRPYSRVIV